MDDTGVSCGGSPDLGSSEGSTPFQSSPVRGQRPFDVESQILSLDREEMEIHQTQLRLLRRQVMTLTGELVSLQREVMSQEALHRNQAAQILELAEELRCERRGREASEIRLRARISELESSGGCSSKGGGDSIKLGDLPTELKDLRAQVCDLSGRLSGACGNVEDAVARERGQRWQRQEEICEKLTVVQRAVDSLELQLRKEVDERSNELRRLRYALDNHTHDLETSFVEEFGSTRRQVLPKVSLQLPPPRPVSPRPPTARAPVPVENGAARAARPEGPLMLASPMAKLRVDANGQH